MSTSPHALSFVDGLDHLGGREAELREVAAGLLPAAGAARRQARAEAELRLDLHALADAVDVVELGRLLDDEDDRLAHLRREQRGLDVLLVLVAVADDQRLVVLMDRHDREQLGLAAGLEAVVERAAVLDDLLDDGAVLVDLDRVDAAVLAAVAVLADRAVERAQSSSMRARRMSLKRSRIGSWMPRATSSSMSSFMSIAPWPSPRGVTIRLPWSLTPK